jgi:hypothetical protein
MSGAAWDLRKAQPYECYSELDFDIPIGKNGDNYDRYCIRMEEMASREGLIADELVLQLATFLRSLNLFLELTVRTVPRTLTATQVRRGGKQGAEGPELSRIHSNLSTWR